MKIEEIEGHIAEANIANEKLLHKLIAVAKAVKKFQLNFGAPYMLDMMVNWDPVKKALKELEKE